MNQPGPAGVREGSPGRTGTAGVPGPQSSSGRKAWGWSSDHTWSSTAVKRAGRCTEQGGPASPAGLALPPPPRPAHSALTAARSASRSRSRCGRRPGRRRPAAAAVAFAPGAAGGTCAPTGAGATRGFPGTPALPRLACLQPRWTRSPGALGTLKYTLPVPLCAAPRCDPGRPGPLRQGPHPGPALSLARWLFSAPLSPPLPLSVSPSPPLPSPSRAAAAPLGAHRLLPADNIPILPGREIYTSPPDHVFAFNKVTCSVTVRSPPVYLDDGRSAPQTAEGVWRRGWLRAVSRRWGVRPDNSDLWYLLYIVILAPSVEGQAIQPPVWA